MPAVCVSGFYGSQQKLPMLFGDEEDGPREKQRQLDVVTEAIREKFATAALSRASGRIGSRSKDRQRWQVQLPRRALDRSETASPDRSPDTLRLIRVHVLSHPICPAASRGGKMTPTVPKAHYEDPKTSPTPRGAAKVIGRRARQSKRAQQGIYPARAYRPAPAGSETSRRSDAASGAICPANPLCADCRGVLTGAASSGSLWGKLDGG